MVENKNDRLRSLEVKKQSKVNLKGANLTKNNILMMAHSRKINTKQRLEE
jgi:hypothetical protein